MSRIVRFHEFGGPEELRLDNVDLPAPSPGEVRLAVEAIGLNRADALLRQNQYIETPELPSKLGYDAAGTVEAVGEGVTGVSVGDRVLTIPCFSQSDHGVYGDAAIVPADALWPCPQGLAPERAACVGVQYTTAYFALTGAGRLERGDTVLLTAATGGVGFAAIEVAKALGAEVVATTRKADKVAALRAAGADHVVVTSEEDLVAKVAEVTGGRGVKLVFDPIAGGTVPAMLECLGAGGRLVIYGALGGVEPTLPIAPLLTKGISVHGFSVFAYTGYAKLGLPPQTAAVAEAREFLLPRLADGRITPVISATFGLEDIVEAHRALESNRQTGKIVVRV